MPLSEQRMRELDAIFARQGLNFGGEEAVGLPGQAVEENIPTDSFSRAALKGFLSGGSGELLDLAANLSGSDFMQQDPNNLFPYYLGYGTGTLVGLPARLGATATRLVGTRLLPKAAPIMQSIAAGALGNAPLGTINALGQDQDPLSSTIDAALLGGIAGGVVPVIAKGVNRAAGRRILPEYPGFGDDAPPSSGPSGGGPAGDSIPPDRYPPPRPSEAPKEKSTVGRTPTGEERASTKKSRSYKEAVEEAENIRNPPPPTVPKYPADLDPEQLAGLGAETRAQNLRQLYPEFAGEAPTPVAPVRPPVTEAALADIDTLLDDAFKDAPFDYSKEVQWGKDYARVLMGSGDKKAFSKPNKFEASIKKIVDDWYKKEFKGPKAAAPAAAKAADSIPDPIEPTVTPTSEPTPSEIVSSPAPPIASALEGLIPEKAPNLPAVRPIPIRLRQEDVVTEGGLPVPVVSGLPSPWRRGTPPVTGMLGESISNALEQGAGGRVPVTVSPTAPTDLPPAAPVSLLLNRAPEFARAPVLELPAPTSVRAEPFEPLPFAASEASEFAMPEPLAVPTVAPLSNLDLRDFSGLSESEMLTELQRRGINVPEDVGPTVAPTVAPTQQEAIDLNREFKNAIKRFTFMRQSLIPEGSNVKVDIDSPFTAEEMLDRLKFEQRHKKQDGKLKAALAPAFALATDAKKFPKLSPERQQRLRDLMENWETANADFSLSDAKMSAAEREIDQMVKEKMENGESVESIAKELIKKFKAITREYKGKLKAGGDEEEELGTVLGGEYAGMQIIKGESTLPGEKKGAELAERIQDALVSLVGPEKAMDMIQKSYGKAALLVGIGAAPILLNIHPKLRENAKQVFGENSEAI